MLKGAHNFSLTFTVLEGYAYGKLIDSDTKANQWTGMVGELQRKNADLTVSELSITKERTEVVSYTQPLYVISRKMYVGTSVDTRRKLLTYATPMTPLLYIAVFVVMTILVVSLVIMSYLQKRFLSPWQEKDNITFKIAIWYIISALLQQGSPTTPLTISSRMVFWYGFMLSLVVYTSYSATLVAFLTVVLPVPLPFNDFYGLVKLSGWDAGNVKNDLFEVIASQTCAGDPQEKCQILQDVWHKVIQKTEGNLVETYMEGLQRAKERNYVFIGVDVTTNNYIKQLPPSVACGIRELPTKYITGGIGIGVQHNSPFLPIFEESLQNLKEMGIMEKLVKKWLKVDTTCAGDALSSADLIDMASVFTILILGVAVSAVALAAERMIHRLKKGNSTRNNYS